MEIAAALRRQPSTQLLALRRSTIARIRAVTASAAQVLAEQDEPRAEVQAVQRRLYDQPTHFDLDGPVAA